MQQAIMSEKLRRQGPAIYLSPHFADVRALEFYHAEHVFEQAAPAKQDLKRRLAQLLESGR
jgi:predicted acylesterase/phospholipase RssA